MQRAQLRFKRFHQLIITTTIVIIKYVPILIKKLSKNKERFFLTTNKLNKNQYLLDYSVMMGRLCHRKKITQFKLRKLYIFIKRDG